MPYRVETASTGRSVCRATECKKNGIKIEKDELRMGTWIEIHGSGSWAWKHWGCVTGHQLQNLRDSLEDPTNPGVYRWDYLDGYEGDEKNSLDKHPELQDKVRGVVTQGFIDPEDFNGDPEMNKLGEKGLYTVETKRKMKQDQVDRTQEIEELKANIEALTAERDHALQIGGSTKKADVKIEVAKNKLEDAEKGMKGAADQTPKAEPGKEKTTKRKRSNAVKEEVDDDDDDDAKPAKKSRAKKAKKEDAEKIKEENDDDDGAKPAKKSRAKKVKGPDTEKIKEENNDAPTAVTEPKKRSARGKGIVKDNSLSDRDDEAEPFELKPKPANKAKSKKAVKEEDLDEQESIDQIVDHPVASSKGQTKKGSKKVIKQEHSGTHPSTSKGDSSESNNSSPEKLAATQSESYIPGIKDSDLRYSFDMARDAGEIDDDFEAYVETRKAELAASQQTKGAKGKKTNGASKSTRRSGRTKST